jgi:hypothetical protein
MAQAAAVQEKGAVVERAVEAVAKAGGRAEAAARAAKVTVSVRAWAPVQTRRRSIHRPPPIRRRRRWPATRR